MIDQPDVGPPRAQKFRAALAGLALMLVGPALWMLSLDQAFLRRSALLMWLAMGAGLLLVGWAAARDRRRRTRLVAVVALAWVAVGISGVLLFTKLPAPAVASSADRIADFTLPDQEGRPVALSHLLKRGPVLLVTYRGHW